MQLKVWLVALAVGLICAQPLAAKPDAAQIDSLIQLGDTAAALAAATALAASNPADARYLILLGQVQIADGQFDLARDTARRAWRMTAGAPDLRFKAAMLGARSAADQGRYGASRFWLRLAADQAQDALQRATVADSFAAVQQRDRSETQFAFAIAPSSNINGGSSAQRLIVDGVSTALLFSGDARALSGAEVRFEIQHHWRLRENAGRAAYLGVRVAGTTYALSSAAQRQAPDVHGADFGTASVDISAWQIAAMPAGQLRYRATLGQIWYGGKPQSRRVRFDVLVTRQFSPVFRGSVSGLVEARLATRSGNRSVATSLTGSVEHSFTNGIAGVDLTLTNLAAPDRRSEAYSGVALAFHAAPHRARRMIEPQITITALFNHYDTALGNIFGNDGRTDKRIAIDLRLDLPRAERFGFVPSVTLTGGRTWSNISRFDGRELTVSFGVNSSF